MAGAGAGAGAGAEPQLTGVAVAGGADAAVEAIHPGFLSSDAASSDPRRPHVQSADIFSSPSAAQRSSTRRTVVALSRHSGPAPARNKIFELQNSTTAHATENWHVVSL